MASAEVFLVGELTQGDKQAGRGGGTSTQGRHSLGSAHGAGCWVTTG